MADPAFWLARFEGRAGELPDGVALLAPGPDGGPPARVVDPVAAGPSVLLGRWRLAARDDDRREARYVPDVA